MDRKSCVVCGSGISSKCHITYHRFPSDVSRMKRWCNSLQLNTEGLSKFSYICSIHFASTDIMKTAKRTYIKPNAIPFVSKGRIQSLPSQKNTARGLKKDLQIALSEYERYMLFIDTVLGPLTFCSPLFTGLYLNVFYILIEQFLKGDDWYSLEACRAVNQAIGRVIRHRNDYGAILLLDTRFNNPRVKSQMSLWLRDHIKVVGNFGELMRDIKLFFKHADEKFQALPKPNVSNVLPAELNTLQTYKSGNFDFSSSSLPTKSTLYNDGEVVVHKVDKEMNPPKRMKISLIDNKPKEDNSLQTSVKEYILMIKKKLDPHSFKSFTVATKLYKEHSNIEEFISRIDAVFQNKAHLRYLIRGLETFIKPMHQAAFREYCDKNSSPYSYSI